MADDKVQEALVIVMKRVMHAALDTGYATAPEWDNYPEIGESDWHAIERMIDTYRNGHIDVTQESYDAAYEFLSQRADAE